jgi:ATP-binding cassette subfamily B protein
VGANGLYAELYRTQFAVADSPTPTFADDVEIVTVPPTTVEP